MDQPETRSVHSQGPGPHRLLRAIVASDSALLGEGLRSLLSAAEVDVVGLAVSSAEAARQVQTQAPDLVFVEAVLLGGDVTGLAALRGVAAGATIIVVGCRGEPAHVGRALAIGAQGYLCQDVSSASLRFATQVALQGLVLFDRAAADELNRTLEAAHTFGHGGMVPAMTTREWQVLELMARGLADRGIAADLAVSLGTVRSHICHILRKLAVPNRNAAIAWASEHGIGQA